jgi:hypothetical protein
MVASAHFVESFLIILLLWMHAANLILLAGLLMATLVPTVVCFEQLAAVWGLTLVAFEVVPSGSLALEVLLDAI